LENEVDAVLPVGAEYLDGLQPDPVMPAVVWVLPFWSTASERP